MKDLLPAHVESAITAHYQGKVRYFADQYDAEAAPPTDGATVDVVREWVAADADHIAWVVGAKVEKVVILNRKDGLSWVWQIGGDADEDGATSYTFTWVDGYLILVYAGDHYFFLVPIHDRDITMHWIMGDAVRVMKDEIIVRAFPPDAPVRSFMLPQLNESGGITREEAELRGLLPISLGLEYHEYHNHYPVGHAGQARG